MKKILTVIFDGFGYREEIHGNAIKQAMMPNYNKFWEQYPHTLLNASEQSVGLKEGQFGNSEVGHMTIGAGKVLRQKQLIASEELDNPLFVQNEYFSELVTSALEENKKVHIMGLLSDGGVHAHIEHFLKIFEHLANQGVKNIYFHAITDGRDTDVHSALKYVNILQEKINELNCGSIASICGRYYAMDRDNRFDRIKLYYDLVTTGKGANPIDLNRAIDICYQKNATDEFLPPILLDKNGLIGNKDILIWMNYRTDRAKQILTTLTNPEFDKFENPVNNVDLYTLFEMDKNIKEKIFFKEEHTDNPLGIYLSKLGLTQARIAETEKYNHVTKFFDCEYTGSIKNCDKFLIPSPKVATYDMKPEMSAIEVTKKAISCLEKDYDFILMNFANSDMVGHTGNMNATIKALEVMDTCFGQLLDAAENNFYTVILLADHGNSDIMIDDNDNIVTTHTINKIPFIISDKKVKLKEDGSLSNVAPTILKYMDIALPEEMKETKDLFVEE